MRIGYYRAFVTNMAAEKRGSICMNSRYAYLVSLAFFAACSAPPGPVASPPDIVVNPSGNAPLAAVMKFQTDMPAVPTRVDIEGGTNSDLKHSDKFATEHEVLVLGLKPGKTQTVTIGLVNETGQTGATQPVSVTTSPLPDYFPPLEITVRKPEKMEPGYSLIPYMKWPKTGLDEKFGLLALYDNEGEVIWYYKIDHTLTEVRRISTGNFVFNRGRNGLQYEIDMLGNTVRQWHTTGIPKEDVPESSVPIETDSFHHDFFEMPGGNFLTLSTEVRHFDDYPASETKPDEDRKESNVIGDIILEFAPAGEIIRQYKFLDFLDPYRICYDSIGTGFWAPVYKDVIDKPGRDWGHANALFYDEKDGSVIVSMYHQDVVFKMDWATGQIKWMLGDPTGWKEPWAKLMLKPVGEDFQWAYHQHGIKLTPQGTILMYDNGTHKAIPPNEKTLNKDNFSRAVEFKVDEAAMTVEQVWSYGGPDQDRFFSPFICDVDHLPQTGNVLITDGGRSRDKDGVDTGSFGDQHWAHIMEVTHTTPAEKVFEIVVQDELPNGWAVYRSERLASLYP